MSCKKSACKKTSIGGQALIEGIMMRGPHKTVMAVRKKDGTIITRPQKVKDPKQRFFLFKWPIIRGVYGFIDSMTVGYKAMMESADLSGYLEEEEAEKNKKKAKKETAEEVATAETAEAAPETASAEELSETVEEKAEETPEAEAKTDKKAKKEKKEKGSGALMGGIMAIASVLAVVLCVVLFLWLPEKAFEGVNYLFGLGGIELEAFRSIFVGVFKILIFFAYMIAVSFMKDIKRVFQYHGAEHKTIFCYEAGLPLTVENVRAQKRFHPRCGTSFLMLMLVVSICVTLLIDVIFPGLTADEMVWLRMLIKVPLIPVICGIGYELIKICGRYDNFITRIIAAPGLWFQRITVKEPDDSMIEVAIAAMEAVIPENEEDDKW